MGVSLQEKLARSEGLKIVPMVRIEDEHKGILGVVGCDESGNTYRLLPTEDGCLAVMAWPDASVSDPDTQVTVGLAALIHSLLSGIERSQADDGRERVNLSWVVGPAVAYGQSGRPTMDSRGAGIWVRVNGDSL